MQQANDAASTPAETKTTALLVGLELECKLAPSGTQVDSTRNFCTRLLIAAILSKA